MFSPADHNVPPDFPGAIDDARAAIAAASATSLSFMEPPSTFSVASDTDRPLFFGDIPGEVSISSPCSWITPAPVESARVAPPATFFGAVDSESFSDSSPPPSMTLSEPVLVTECFVTESTGVELSSRAYPTLLAGRLFRITPPEVFRGVATAPEEEGPVAFVAMGPIDDGCPIVDTFASAPPLMLDIGLAAPVAFGFTGEDGAVTSSGPGNERLDTPPSSADGAKTVSTTL